MAQILDVYLHTALVGHLSVDRGSGMRFQYQVSWLHSEQAVPLSLALPLREAAFDNEVTTSFFTNLLPESELRRALARNLGVSEGNGFALLEAIGGECAGAISLLPEAVEPPMSGGYKALGDDALEQRLRDLPKQPMLAGEQGLRLSLAGAQNKLPVLFDGCQISLTLDHAPSSHILKPPIERYPDSVYNEAFCMQLATRIGLPVPRVTILYKSQPLYLIERYDRRETEQGIQRVHQEDFCQAMGVPPEQKYEKEGGPTLAQCFNVIREHSLIPFKDLQSLLDWVMFNYLIGNADAHGKNISLLLTEQGPKLAPFYDLMSTAVSPELAERMAMKIGREDRPDWIIERKWQRFADDVGISYKHVRRCLLRMSEQLEETAQDISAEFVTEHPLGQTVVERIVALIEERKSKVARMMR